MADPIRARGIARDLSALGRSSMARWVAGECLLQERDVEGALGEWRAVLESEPSSLDALFSLGTYYLDNDDHAAAETYLSRAARLYPDTPVVLYTHGRNLYFLERYRDAIAELQKARMVAGDREDYPLVDYLVGVSSHRLGQEGEAAASLEAYLKWAYKQSTLTRLEVDAHLKLSEIYDKQGKRLKAHQEKQKGEDLLRRIQEYAERTAAHAGPSASKPAGPPAPPRP